MLSLLSRPIVLAVLCLTIAPWGRHGQASDSRVPLMPEDGSGGVRAWYFSEENHHFKSAGGKAEIEAISRRHGFRLVSLGRSYEWTQDVALFDESGSFLAPAAYPVSTPGLSLPWFDGLTRGVYDDENPEGPYRLQPSQFEHSRSLTVAFPEGGALISGRLSDGRPYVLSGGGLVARARSFLSRMKSREVSHHEAHREVAKDLGVLPENLLELPTRRHLDLFLVALPGGRVLLDDPRLVVTTLDEVLPGAAGEERARIEALRRLYADGFTPSWDRGSPARRPFDSGDLASLDRIAEILSTRLEVIRVAGRFSELDSQRNGAKETVNFFNAFQGTDDSGTHWMVTNQAVGLPSLERHWRELIRLQSRARSVEVYFPGRYFPGAGIDCSGAVGR
jgi:hypothetical protein